MWKHHRDSLSQMSRTDCPLFYCHFSRDQIKKCAGRGAIPADADRSDFGATQTSTEDRLFNADRYESQAPSSGQSHQPVYRVGVREPSQGCCGIPTANERMLPVSRAARTARLPDRLRTSRRRMKQRVCRQSDPGTSPVDQVRVSDPYSESFTTTLCPARAKCASKPSTEVSGWRIRPAS